MMYGITAATGNLGRYALEEMLERVPAAQIVALARRPELLESYVRRGITVRFADYEHPASLAPAMAGIDRLLFISSGTLAGRESQHAAVVHAAKTAGTGFLAYTSVLHAPTTPMLIASDHRATEAMLQASGLPHALLRNSWYTEIFIDMLTQGLEQGELTGAWGEGLIMPASRRDLARAAAVVLAAPAGEHAGAAYELAGDEAFTMAELIHHAAASTGRPLVYRDMDEGGYAAHLRASGLPEELAALIANSNAAAAQGALQDRSGTLRKLIGRPTTSWKTCF